MEKIKCTIERITYQNPENLILTVCAIIVPLKMAFLHKKRGVQKITICTPR